jgi:hypothetical protein
MGEFLAAPEAFLRYLWAFYLYLYVSILLC